MSKKKDKSSNHTLTKKDIKQFYKITNKIFKNSSKGFRIDFLYDRDDQERENPVGLEITANGNTYDFWANQNEAIGIFITSKFKISRTVSGGHILLEV